MRKTEIKTSFLIKKEYLNVIHKRKPEQKAELFDCMFDYQTTGEYTTKSERVEDMMTAMIDYRNKNDEKYDEVCEKNRLIALDREKKKKQKNTNVHERAQSGEMDTNSTDKNRLDKIGLDENRLDKENNNLSTIVDKEQSSFGDEEINNCLDLIKKFNGGIIDGTHKEQRIYGKNLIGKLKEIESVKNGNYTRNQVLETILQIVSQNTYHAQKIAGPKKIYYELGGLMQICKSEFTKKKKSEIPFIPGI